MKTTYTVTSKLPLPTVGVHQASILMQYQPGAISPSIDIRKTKQWLDDVTHLVAHPSTLFAAMVDGVFHVSLTDKEVAEKFEKQWGDK